MNSEKCNMLVKIYVKMMYACTHSQVYVQYPYRCILIFTSVSRVVAICMFDYSLSVKATYLIYNHVIFSFDH